MKPCMRIAALCLLLGFAEMIAAKLPPPTDEDKAKATAAKEKADSAAKQAAEQLTAAQDRVAARYLADTKARAGSAPAASGAAAASEKKQ
jgi:hypothetical protein